MSNNNKRKLILNLSPIRYEDKKIDVGVFDYHDKDQLRNLRTENYKTHIFRRLNNEIICVPFTADPQPIGDSFREIHLKKNIALSASLVQNALINYLHSIERQILEYLPLTFLSDNHINFVDA